MSVNRDDAQLVLALADLSRVSPRLWSEVLAELKKRSDRIRDQMVSATDNSVFVNQGRARESGSLLGLFESCQAEAESIKVSLQKQRAKPTS